VFSLQGQDANIIYYLISETYDMRPKRSWGAACMRFFFGGEGGFLVK